MPILDPVKLGIVPCMCGRLSNKLHCPKCGSYVIRGVNKMNTRTDPTTLEQTEYQVYRCRVCFRIFDDFEWQNECIAPQFETHSSRLQNGLRGGNSNEISRNIKDLPITKKTFSPLIMEKAATDPGKHQTRIDGMYKGNRKKYIEMYEETWSQIDKNNGTEPPPEIIKIREQTEVLKNKEQE